MKTRELTIEYDALTRADQYDVIVPDPGAPRAVVERLLAAHPEQPEGPLGELVREMLPLFEQIQAAAAVAAEPGVAFHDGCLGFTVLDGRAFLVPLDRLRRIILGPVRELADVTDERLRALRPRQGHA